jgi:hypothetical protein
MEFQSPRVIARSDSDAAIFDMLVTYFSIEDCHATLTMTFRFLKNYHISPFDKNGGDILSAPQNKTI